MLSDIFHSRSFCRFLEYCFGASFCPRQRFPTHYSRCSSSSFERSASSRRSTATILPSASSRKLCGIVSIPNIRNRRSLSGLSLRRHLTADTSGERTFLKSSSRQKPANHRQPSSRQALQAGLHIIKQPTGSRLLKLLKAATSANLQAWPEVTDT